MSHPNSKLFQTIKLQVRWIVEPKIGKDIDNMNTNLSIETIDLQGSTLITIAD